jgi:hypothetical protein
MNNYIKIFILIVAAGIGNAILTACNKPPVPLRCVTTLAAVNLDNCALENGSIYADSIYYGANVNIAHESYALKLSFVDSVLQCDQVSIAPRMGLGIQSAYATDPTVTAHTLDRIAELNVVLDSITLQYLLPFSNQEIINSFSFNIYLQDHRHENLNAVNIVEALNQLLSAGNSNKFYAGNYLPEVYIRVSNPLLLGIPLNMHVFATLTSGKQLHSQSKTIYLK